MAYILFSLKLLTTLTQISLKQIVVMFQVAIHTKIGTALPLFDKLANALLGYEPFRAIYMDENQKFDLIILQTYINPTLYALSAKMKTPIIGVSSMGLWSGSHVAAGNPNPPSIYSEMYLPYNGDLRYICVLFY